MDPTPPSERFRELAARLRGDEPGIALADVALAVAGEFQPDLDPAAVLAELDRLAREVAPQAPPSLPLAARIDRLVKFLHLAAGFRGNEQHYDDPRNSFLNEVLARRTGIPITLAIVYVEVGARIALALRGVSFPGHFLVRSAADPPIVIDAFHGAVLDEHGCAALLARVQGARHALGTRREGAGFGPERLAPASPADVAVRMLSNLKHGYAGRGEWVRALDCTERILLVTPGAPAELRDRGLLYEQLECFGSALADLERFLALAPGAPEASAIRARIEALRPRAAIH